MNELKEFLKFAGMALGAIVALAAIISGIWLGGAWLYGQSKVIVAGFAVQAARIDAGGE